MKHRALIVYYSHSGNTEQIAHCIQEKTRGDLLKIEPQVAYPTDYHTVVEQAKKGNQSKISSGIGHKTSRSYRLRYRFCRFAQLVEHHCATDRLLSDRSESERQK